MAVPFDDSPGKNFISSFNHTGEGVIIDIGTGDGHYVYQSARQNPARFYIGIDPNTRPLRKVSEKIYRKATKGGVSNALFIQASIEDLPSELDGVADEVHVHFPWGSLLSAIVNGELKTMQCLRRICADDALLEVVTGLDPERDAAEIDRLNLQPLSADYIGKVLRERYNAAGFEIVEYGVISKSDVSKIKSSWARRLGDNPNRPITYWIARTVDQNVGTDLEIKPDK